jgi:hypothetical protein
MCREAYRTAGDHERKIFTSGIYPEDESTIGKGFGATTWLMDFGSSS